MLEVPVSYVVEDTGMQRSKAVWVIACLILLVSIVISYNFDLLFGLVISFTTQYSQPLLGFMLCVFAGWVWHRNAKLAALKKGFDDVEQSLFWKIWPWYVKFVCPVIILLTFITSL